MSAKQTGDPGDAQVCLDAPKLLEDQHKDNLIKVLQAAFATPRQVRSSPDQLCLMARWRAEGL